LRVPIDKGDKKMTNSIGAMHLTLNAYEYFHLKQIIIESSCMGTLKHQRYDERHMFLTKPIS
jgi:hypothetical protein